MDYYSYYRQNPPILNADNILLTKYADVNGDNIIDTVYLVGNKPVNNDSPFIKNIKIIIEDGKTKQLYTINLLTNSGYNPELSLVNFTKSKVNEIFVSIDSGGSGGYGYFYIYSFLNNIEKKLFDYEEFNNRYRYDVMYKDDYKVEVISKDLKKRFIICIGDKGINYLSSIYKPNGTLIKPIKGYVLALNDLYPVDINRDGIYDLVALQRVIGLYGADTLANIETYLHLNNQTFVPFNNKQNIITYGIDI